MGPDVLINSVIYSVINVLVWIGSIPCVMLIISGVTTKKGPLVLLGCIGLLILQSRTIVGMFFYNTFSHAPLWMDVAFIGVLCIFIMVVLTGMLQSNKK